MSGIFGIFGRNGSPIDPTRSFRMMQATLHRGRDAQSEAHGDGFILGQCMLDTAAGGPAMGQLLVKGELVIVADCRLDNREELTATLGIAASASDTEMLLHAYVRWKNDCPKFLLGDFAFAILDKREKSLFCARDHFGVKPFYYYDDPGSFVFCSEVEGIFASGLAERRILPESIADFLLGLPPAVDETSFKGVRPLPPGHCCVISEQGLRVEAYYKLRAAGTVKRKDAPAEFRHLFTQAVQARLRGGPVGAMLSGGLDSSSISCVAALLLENAGGSRLPTFSLVYDETPELNERPFIEAVLSLGGFSPSFIQSNNLQPLAELDTIVDEQQDLFHAPNVASSRQLPYCARDAGIRVLLDGHGGDNVAPVGWGRMHELAAAGKWITVWRQLSGVQMYPEVPKLPVFWDMAEQYTPLRRVRRYSRSVRRRLGLLGAVSNPVIASINPVFAKRVNLTERRRRHATREPGLAVTEHLLHHEGLTEPLQTHAFEVLDRNFAAAGIEGRYPFWDKRVVEFCLSLDPADKLNDGWGRLILRRGMEGILPKQVQWRRYKFEFGRHLATSIVRHHVGLITKTLADNQNGLGDYVDLDFVKAALARLERSVAQPNGYEMQIILRTMVLASWLRRNTAPVYG